MAIHSPHLMLLMVMIWWWWWRLRTFHLQKVTFDEIFTMIPASNSLLSNHKHPMNATAISPILKQLYTETTSNKSTLFPQLGISCIFLSLQANVFRVGRNGSKMTAFLDKRIKAILRCHRRRNGNGGQWRSPVDEHEKIRSEANVKRSNSEAMLACCSVWIRPG